MMSLEPGWLARQLKNAHDLVGEFPSCMKENLILSVTGHRPDKLIYKAINCYDPKSFNKLTDFAQEIIHEEYKTKNLTLITGMALGWDMACAIACIKLNISFIAAVPFLGQDKIWKPLWRCIYKRILDKASKIEVISAGGFSAQKMQVRNEWMVNNSQEVLALYNGTKGGTGNCVEYAKESNKVINNVWNKWLEFSK